MGISACTPSPRWVSPAGGSARRCRPRAAAGAAARAAGAAAPRAGLGFAGVGVKCIAAFLLLLLLAWQPACPPPPPGRCYPWPCCNSIKWGQQRPKLLRGGISPPGSGSEGRRGIGDTRSWASLTPDPLGFPLGRAVLGVPGDTMATLSSSTGDAQWETSRDGLILAREQSEFSGPQWVPCLALAVPLPPGVSRDGRGGGPSLAGDSNPVVSIRLVS